MTVIAFESLKWGINNSNSNLESQSAAPMEDEVQDITEIEVDSPEIIESVEFTKENAQLLMNTFSQAYSKEEKTEIYDSYVTSPSITVSKKCRSKKLLLMLRRLRNHVGITPRDMQPPCVVPGGLGYFLAIIKEGNSQISSK